MAIKVECDLKISEDCEGELEEAGALLFSPPPGDIPFEGGRVDKLYACKPCWKKLTTLIRKERRMESGE